MEHAPEFFQGEAGHQYEGCASPPHPPPPYTTLVEPLLRFGVKKLKYNGELINEARSEHSDSLDSFFPQAKHLVATLCAICAITYGHSNFI